MSTLIWAYALNIRSKVIIHITYTPQELFLGKKGSGEHNYVNDILDQKFHIWYKYD